MSRGWFNLESAGGAIPETQFFEGDSAFKSFGFSRKTRLYGFIGCLIAGFVLSILGSTMLFLANITMFAILYALGTVTALIGTGFLIGFLKQLKLAFKPIRVVATIIFIASIIMVMVAAFPLDSDILCIVFVIVQYLAYLWYSISYIPYARAGVKKAVGFG